ncbi:MAG: FtsQ-type POTRA domain-containing protein [Desulfomicrobium sp.]|nr:FtsQ-type POTRA domain-containing protein [Pseudomonadota bacterium]MBV1711302.1 FtsQ-type POTRA domain-containing protein [Desulfomicrobium sp.]MBU4569973.1 FtsQ-type POTRA domain-containing protein [Pseudomonadota bacterium]MBU4595072.1 FtsQ-type POTRA domain-containing protein [Pseudomonadota bacterium]MBV1720627.1 FtsQ-type POTRA domain-containing protein [Desulfomicrobium sp.]
MNTAVMGKKVRRNVPRRKTREQTANAGAMLGGFIFGLCRTILVLTRWTLGIAALLVVSFGILFAYRWVTAHEFFALVNLRVEGSQRLSPEEIAELGGVGTGINVLNINIAEVQRRIAASEWVESVGVTRVLPDGLIIEVSEREPAFLTRRDGQLFYADAGGHIIAPVSVDKFISLPLLETEEGTQVGSGIRMLLDEVARNSLPFGMSQIAWLRQDSAEQFSIFLEKPRVLVQLDGADLGATLTSLNRLWADLRGRGELDRTAFMFVMPKRAWIRLHADQTL